MQHRPNYTMRLILFILFFLSLFATHLFAADYSYIYKFEQPEITTLSNGKHLLEMTGTRQQDDRVGAPILPVKTSKLFIPANEAVVSIDIDYGTLKTIEGSYRIQHVTTPHPLSFKGSVHIDKPDPAIYESNADYPSHVYRNMRPQILHGGKIVLVDLMPVRYNPLDGQLKYYKKLIVRLRTEKQTKPDLVMPFRNSITDRNKILRTIENKDDFLIRHPDPKQKSAKALPMAEAYNTAAGTRQYVVITTRTLASAFETLTSHRSSAEGGGYTTHIEYIDTIDAAYAGVDLAEKMRNFIRDMYTNHGTQYVLLGGDSDGSPENQVIPTRLVYAQFGDYSDDNIPSDLYFGCLDGSWNADGDELWGEFDDGIDGGDIDWFSEVYVGRIPADDYSEAMNQISKIIAFETGNQAGRTLLVGEELEDSTWGGDRMDWVYSYMDAIPKTALYDRDWGNNSWPNSQLLSYINSNKFYWINHLGHSTVVHNMGLDHDDVSSMTNSNYFFVYAQGCYSGSIDGLNKAGAYEYADSFGEAITTDYNDRGAFAYIGNSRYGFYTPGSNVERSSNLAHKEFVEAVFTENITKLGEANQKSKTDLPLSSGLYRWIAFETNLLGCPASELVAPYPLDDDCEDCEIDYQTQDSPGDGGGGGGGCFVGSLRD
jgi:peptidase C25-like protein